ncbi:MULTISPECIES: hypothetical protein [unclassified Streptomyces]|uniref:hypothetical protein n=1 Tax=unclassified Streptomyces TaxID=2593676 RepID=UPI003D91FCED
MVLTWWLRRGKAAVWSLLRWAVAFVSGLAAWWQVAGRVRGVPDTPGLVRRVGWEPVSLRGALLRYVVHRRGPPWGMASAI